jgi:hypothetical protein
MVRRHSVVIIFTLLAFSAVTSLFARSILEKRIYYLNSDGKPGVARFWAIYLGNHDCTLTRKRPGEAEKKIVASMNLQLLSSGYIEGNGYGETGKVQSLPTMHIRQGDKEDMISIDSIEYIYDFGRKVHLHSGRDGDFVINVEGDKKMARKFLMREYKLTKLYGEEILKEGSEETALSAIAFSKSAIAKAKAAQAALK